MAPTIRSAPPGIFLRHPHHQPLGFLVNSRTTPGFAKLRSVELVGDELSVPGQQRIRFRDSRQFFQGLPFEPVGDLSQRSFFGIGRSEEHTSELQSQSNLVCRLLLEKKKKKKLEYIRS